ncbi:lytic polysaccharide monooxygenase [Aplosporella prunicola CBS 121167]|uniref:Lytic polysaccharide monooxygenase n=1 Tax=Aplosporella prunicola CBS 121167 TaxID=1176127 RepID=A0A6A6BNG5_9PEZI|nr:lytic polysaccharide monooxygenase [Aplosporella prunicola CBS 121167]KAF2145652.1 lytic polysaccharide monooxygenase [Aplosporella prunicola CBS 121167]
MASRITFFLGIFGALASIANGHMILNTPHPYGPETLNNSPLASFAEFPCKQRQGVYAASKGENKFSVGDSQSLTFTGSAVHGGGSCQVSISMDKEPTASSTFKVIHSIVGGCPGVGSSPSDFKFSVPKGFPNGEFALAWTWFNHIGAREFYMNCAPITVTGGADGEEGKKFFNSLPDMYVTNLPGQSGTRDTACDSPEGKDLTFPNPGDSVETVGSGPFATLAPSCGQVAGSSNAGTANSNDEPAAPQASSAVTSQAAASPAPTPAAGPAQGNTQSFSTVYVTATVTTPKTSQSTAGSVGGSFAESGSSGSTGSGSSGSTEGGSSDSTCGSDGTLVCNGEDKFGICDHGKIVWKPVASGTKCNNGKIMKRGLRFYY